MEGLVSPRSRSALADITNKAATPRSATKPRSLVPIAPTAGANASNATAPPAAANNALTALERIRQIRDKQLASKAAAGRSTAAVSELHAELATASETPVEALSPVDLDVPHAEHAGFHAPATAAPSATTLRIPSGSIPTALCIDVHMPSPPALPSPYRMSHADLLRELAAVSRMREAETAAAIEYLERCSAQQQQATAAAEPAAAITAPIRGVLDIVRRSTEEEAAAAPAAAAAAAAAPDAAADAKLQGMGIPLSPSYGFGATTDDGATGVAFTEAAFVTARSCIAVTARTATAPAPAPAADVTVAAAPGVQLRVHISPLLQPRTLAYEVPRVCVSANAPLIGAAPAVDALTALKQLLNTRIEAAGGGSGAAAASPLAAALAGMTTDAPASEAAAQAAAQAAGQAIAALLSSHCRVWPHAHLTPAQSEARVQTLLARIREETGYEVTSPIAPLAQTRLGTAHITASAAGAAAATGATSTAGPAATPAKGFNGTASGISTAATPLVLHGAGRSATALTSSRGPLSSSTSGSSGSGQPAVAFTVTTRAMIRSPTPRKRSAPGAPLLTPVPQLAALPTPFTPPPAAQKALARYISSGDCTRAGASPASFDRESHRAILQSMQRSLDAMVAQRREEEGHMLRQTRVKPAKHPQGGYWYQHVDLGRQVTPKQYEHLYMAEVNFATEYINAQALEQWAIDAEARVAEIASWSPARRAAEIAAIQHAVANRISWWHQDIEEGFAADGMVVCADGSNYSNGYNTAAAAATTCVIGGALQSFITQWVDAAKATIQAAAAGITAVTSLSTTTAPAPAAAPLCPAFAPLASTDGCAGIVATVPFTDIAALSTATTQLLTEAADKLLAGAMPTAYTLPSAEARSALWRGITAAVVAYMASHGAGVAVPAEASLQTICAAFNAVLSPSETTQDATAVVPASPAPAASNNTDSIESFSFVLSPAGLNAVAAQEEGMGITASISIFDAALQAADAEIAAAAAATPDAVLTDAIATYNAAAAAEGRAPFQQHIATTTTAAASPLTGIALHMLPAAATESDAADSTATGSIAEEYESDSEAGNVDADGIATSETEGEGEAEAFPATRLFDGEAEAEAAEGVEEVTGVHDSGFISAEDIDAPVAAPVVAPVQVRIVAAVTGPASASSSSSSPTPSPTGSPTLELAELELAATMGLAAIQAAEPATIIHSGEADQVAAQQQEQQQEEQEEPTPAKPCAVAPASPTRVSPAIARIFSPQKSASRLQLHHSFSSSSSSSSTASASAAVPAVQFAAAPAAPIMSPIAVRTPLVSALSASASGSAASAPSSTASSSVVGEQGSFFKRAAAALSVFDLLDAQAGVSTGSTSAAAFSGFGFTPLPLPPVASPATLAATATATATLAATGTTTTSGITTGISSASIPDRSPDLLMFAPVTSPLKTQSSSIITASASPSAAAASGGGSAARPQPRPLPAAVLDTLQPSEPGATVISRMLPRPPSVPSPSHSTITGAAAPVAVACSPSALGRRARISLVRRLAGSAQNAILSAADEQGDSAGDAEEGQADNGDGIASS